jgi:dihydroflavonol-4-reductase
MILVTGGTGLVGSHLLFDLVKKGEKPRAIYRSETKIKEVKKVFSYYSENYEELFAKIEWVKGDVLDIVSLDEAFDNVNKVYHCAAAVAIGGMKPDELIDANVSSTANVVDLCLDRNVKKLCHVSSIAALGNSNNGDLINESSNWIATKDRSAYSVSKFKSEMEVWRGIQEGLNAVIVNPSVILGPGFWETGSGSLFSKAAKGLKYYTSGATGFVFVKDVVDAMIKLMESEISSERFVLNSENLSYKPLFDMIADVMQVQKPKREATLGLLKFAAILDWLASKIKIKKREITKQVAISSLSVSKYSNEKIKKTIGMDFKPIVECINEIAEKYNKELKIN